MDKTKFRPIGVENDKADNSVIAPVESGTTASRAYAKGAHFIKNGAFCTAKTAIAQGETFTLNTNYTAGDVGAVLETTAHGSILNSEYGITIYYYSVGNIVLIEPMSNRLTKAIPQNTWITLTSNIPSVNANFYPQASTISFNGQVLSFYIIGTDIRILCRSSGGLAINDGFSIEMAYIKA